MSTDLNFVVLPYVKTSAPVTIRGVTFRDCADLEGVPADIQSHLLTLFSMFFLRDDLRIRHVSYTYFELVGDLEKDRVRVRRLAEARSLLSYFYTTPHPLHGYPYLTAEHATMFTFWPDKFSVSLISPDDGLVECVGQKPVSEDRFGRIQGYRGILNEQFERDLHVVPGCRIYPPPGDFTLNIPQDLAQSVAEVERDRSLWALVELIAAQDAPAPEVEEHIFTAMDWYSRSASNQITELEAVLYLAIAFETLLNLDEGASLTARFKETVLTLLGPVPRLDSWLTQFYEARSKASHRGRWPHLGFYPLDKVDRAQLARIASGQEKEVMAPVRSLTADGRLIFRMCLNVTLSGALQAKQRGLSALLVSSQQRLERMRTRLQQKGEAPEKRLLAVRQDVQELSAYWYTSHLQVQPETALDVGVHMIRTLLETKPSLPANVEQQMQELLRNDKGTAWERLEAFGAVASLVETWKGDVPTSVVSNVADPQLVVWSYLRFVSMYVL